MRITEEVIIEKCNKLNNIDIDQFILFTDSNSKCIVKCKCGRIHTVSKCMNLYRYSNKLYFKCYCKKKELIYNKYKTMIMNNIPGYTLIDVLLKNDESNEGNKIKLNIKHDFCGESYYIEPYGLFNRDQRCSHCCGSYENSFAHHIEVELGESLDKYWDFDKNTVNPNCISKNRNAKDKEGNNLKVWIKCTETDYHGSYEVACNQFAKGVRCGYCGNHKIHPRDSFAQYHIDNTDKDFLEKYWDYEKNMVSPWEISPNTHKKVWIKCQGKKYHGSYEIICGNFTNNKRCPYCNTFASGKVHLYDSFGYHNFDKVQSWHPDNDTSPFRVAPNSNNKYKFICETCTHEWSSNLSNINKGSWCPVCATSKGEKKVREWLDMNNVNYIHDKPYFNDLLSDLGNPLRPDFILPEHKIWIEYDGEFHYKDIYGDGSYETLKIHDKYKDKYAKEHGWNLIRIPYWDFDNIEIIISAILK